MAKLDVTEIWQYNQSLELRVSTIRTLYQELKIGILTLTDIQEQVNMNKKQVLGFHKKMYNYWQGKNGKWYSYLPKKGVEPPKGKQIESVSEERLNSKIIDYYVEEEKVQKQSKKHCPTFLEVYHMWRKLKDLELVDNSIYKYNTDCKRFFEGTNFAKTPINEINENTIRLFVLETAKELELCKKACGKFFGYIKNVIRYARIEKIILDNPIEFLEPKDLTRHCIEVEKEGKPYYTNSELLTLLKGLHNHYALYASYMPAYAVEMAIYTGMRVSELCTLKWADIDEYSISINKSAKYNRLKNEFFIGKTKTKKSRVYPIDEQIIQLLERIKQVQLEHGIFCEWIFADDNGHYIQAGKITSYMTRLCRECDLDGGGITKLRKTTSSDLQTNGTPKAVVASMLGHTTEVNEKYYTYDTSNLEQKQRIIQSRNVKFRELTPTQ